MDVPVKATIISSVFTLGSLIGISFYIALDDFWALPIIVTIPAAIVLPLTLIFSVKHTKNNNVNVQPPQQLHFHQGRFSGGKHGISFCVVMHIGIFH